MEKQENENKKEVEFVSLDNIGILQGAQGLLTLTKCGKVCFCPYKVQDFSESAYKGVDDIRDINGRILPPTCSSMCPLFRAKMKGNDEIIVTINCGAAPMNYVIPIEIKNGDAPVKSPLLKV
jgi:hypothetical protein